MPEAWTCTAEPERHGSFLQSGLDTLSALYGSLQPRNRYGCPICLSINQPGWLRPSTQAETARLAETQGV